MQKLIILLFLGFSACHSGWDKDPFVGQSANVQNAIAKGAEKKAVPPLFGVLFVDAEPFYNVKQGQVLETNIGYRITHPEFQFHSLLIKNIDETLPGASFDGETGELKFDVSQIRIPVETAVFVIPFTVSLVAEYQGVLHEMPVNSAIHIIRRNFTSPTVERVEGLPNFVKEFSGDYPFSIIVRDDEPSSVPTLNLLPDTLTSTSGAQYIEYEQTPVPVENEPGLWRFKARVVMGLNKEITNSNGTFRFKAIATSVYGVSSMAKTFFYGIYTKASNPLFFADSRVIFKKGEKSTYSFTVADTRNEGKIEASFVSPCGKELGKDSRCYCQNVLNLSNSVNRCFIEWTPADVGTVKLNIKATNTTNELSVYYKDQAISEFEMTLQVAP